MVEVTSLKIKYSIFTLASVIMVLLSVVYPAVALSSVQITNQTIPLTGKIIQADLVIKTVGNDSYAIYNSDNTLAFISSDASYILNNAISSLTNGGTIFINSGIYFLSSTIKMYSNINLIGAGSSTILTYPPESPILMIND